MAKRKKLEDKVQQLADRLLEQLTDEELLRTLDPCSRFIVKLTFVRGQNKVRRDGVSSLSERPAGKTLVADKEALTEKDWKKILSLQEFSTNPKRRSDRKYRAIMLEFKQEGCAPDYIEVHKPSLNDILKINKLPYRIVWGGNDDRVFRLYRIF